MQKNDNTPREERTSDSPTAGYREKAELAEQLMRDLLILLEYDQKSLDKLLLFIDLFENNSHDAVLVNLMASEARATIFGMSPVAQDQYDAHITKLRQRYGIGQQDDEAGGKVESTPVSPEPSGDKDKSHLSPMPAEN